MGPYFKMGLCRGNQVEMRSLGWALIQYDRCPYEKETDTQGEGPVMMEEETGMLQI